MNDVREEDDDGDLVVHGEGSGGHEQQRGAGTSKLEAEPAPSAGAPASTLEALLYICTWYCLSTLLSIYNKKVLGGGKQYGILKDPNFPDQGFPAPLMMTALQFVGQYLLATLGHACGARRTSDPDNPRAWRAWSTGVLPNGVATGLDIGFSNWSLSVISLSFYTMCKSSAPLFLLLCAFLWRIEKPTWGLAGIVVVISTGLVMLVDGELEFNLLGFFLVMSAAAMSGVRWTITQILVQGSGGHSASRGTALEVLEAVTPIMAATVALVSISAEPLHRIWTDSIYLSSVKYVALTLGMVGLGAVVAFFMVLVEFVLIAKTSALTFMVAGVFKEFLTVVVAHFVFGDELSLMNIFGLIVLIIGVALFNLWKYDKLRKEKEAVFLVVGDASPSEANNGFGGDEQLLLAAVGGSGKSAQEMELSVSSPPPTDPPAIAPDTLLDSL